MKIFVRLFPYGTSHTDDLNLSWITSGVDTIFFGGGGGVQIYFCNIDLRKKVIDELFYLFNSSFNFFDQFSETGLKIRKLKKSFMNIIYMISYLFGSGGIHPPPYRIYITVINVCITVSVVF